MSIAVKHYASLVQFINERKCLQLLTSSAAAEAVPELLNESKSLMCIAVERAAGTLADLDRCDDFSDGRFRKLVRLFSLVLPELHKQGLVHRDIKPDNILIFKGQGDADVKSSDETFKLNDYGSSCELGAASSFFAGTPAYAALGLTRLALYAYGLQPETRAVAAAAHDWESAFFSLLWFATCDSEHTHRRLPWERHSRAGAMFAVKESTARDWEALSEHVAASQQGFLSKLHEILFRGSVPDDKRASSAADCCLRYLGDEAKKSSA